LPGSPAREKAMKLEDSLARDASTHRDDDALPFCEKLQCGGSDYSARK